jgi:Fur family peroxide stress response transcriptional regulator
MIKLQDYINAFREKSIKITPQRLTIFKVLEGNTNHPSAEDIYKEVLKINSTISFATVYNTLDKLYELNLLLKLNIEEEKNHYDPNINEHHHFLCRQCRKIIDIFDDYDIKPKGKIKEIIKIDSCQVNFYGICGECR